jgi:MFS family permease
MVITTSSKSILNQSLSENRTFRRLLRASSISMLGSHLTTIAYPLLVLHLTGSPFTAGCAVFAATAPSILVYIPAGALVDRWNPRRVMLLSELGRGVAIGTVSVTLAFGNHMVAPLMMLAVIEGVLEVFSGLAERRYVGSIVGPDQIPSAQVRIEARTHVVLVAGRPLGGFLFGIGPIFPFLSDMASFVYSVITLLAIKDSKPAGNSIESPHGLPPKVGLINDIRQGLKWIYEDKFARMATISFSVGTLIFQALIMVFLDSAQSRHLSTLAVGAALAASGVGGAIGSLAATRLLARIGHSWIQVQAGIWSTGFAFLVLSIGPQFLATTVIMAILGFTGALGNIALDTHLMQSADQEMLARVTSVGRLTSFAACAIGPIMGGFLVQEFGAQDAMLSLFCLTPVLLLLSAFTPPASRGIRAGERGPSRMDLGGREVLLARDGLSPERYLPYPEPYLLPAPVLV